MMVITTAKGRKARSRYFTHEEIERGMGLLLVEAPDFPRADRDRLADQLLAAYEAGLISEDLRPATYGVYCACKAKAALLDALRWFLRCDGREMVAQVRQVATVVPALTALANWI